MLFTAVRVGFSNDATCRDLNAFYGEPLTLVISFVNGTLQSHLVIPLGYFRRPSQRRLQLCLAVGLDYVFQPTPVTVDVRPPNLVFMGGATTASPYLRVTQGTPLVVIPFEGYGVMQGMKVYVGTVPCFSASFKYDIVRQWTLAPLELDTTTSSTTTVSTSQKASLGIILTANDTSSVTGPLSVCLYHPLSDEPFTPTPFFISIVPPSVTSLQNMATNLAVAQIQYGVEEDLVIMGRGIGFKTLIVPAQKCNNRSTFLWTAPIPLSSASVFVAQQQRTSAGDDLAFASYSYNSQTGEGTWFLPITAEQSTKTPTKGAQLQWCVSFNGNGTFASTGIPYNFRTIIPDGFLLANGVVDPTLIMPVSALFMPIKVVGGLDLVREVLAFLQPQSYPCSMPPASRIFRPTNASATTKTLVDSRTLFSLRYGKGVVLPRNLEGVGSFVICYATVKETQVTGDDAEDLDYATQTSDEAEITIALSEFMLAPKLVVTVIPSPVVLFSLNYSLTLSILQGDSAVVAVDGLNIDDRSLRIADLGDDADDAVKCKPVAGALGDLRIATLVDTSFEVVIPSVATRVSGKFAVCISNPISADTPWIVSPIRVNIIARTLSAINGSSDVLAVATVTSAASAPVRLMLSGVNVDLIPRVMLGDALCLTGVQIATQRVSSTAATVSLPYSLAFKVGTLAVCTSDSTGSVFTKSPISLVLRDVDVTAVYRSSDSTPGSVLSVKRGESLAVTVKGWGISSDTVLRIVSSDTPCSFLPPNVWPTVSRVTVTEYTAGVTVGTATLYANQFELARPCLTCAYNFSLCVSRAQASLSNGGAWKATSIKDTIQIAASAVIFLS